jgi:hypothetical protein
MVGRPTHKVLKNMVGAAGIEPATAGLEIRRAYFLRRFPSMFSASYYCALMHSVTFRDDLLRGVGHDFGHDFLWCQPRTGAPSTNDGADLIRSVPKRSMIVMAI